MPGHPPTLLYFLLSSLNILITFIFLDVVYIPTSALMIQASVQHVFLLILFSIREMSGMRRLGRTAHWQNTSLLISVKVLTNQCFLPLLG